MTVRVLAVPYDSGRLDWRHGRGAIALADVSGRSTERVTVDEGLTGLESELAVITAVRDAVAEADGGVLVLAGNCNATVGVLAAHDDRTGLVWFDAHADLHTPETTTSGFFDGMSLALAAGRFRAGPGLRVTSDERIVLAGVREVDDAERDAAGGIEVVPADRLEELDGALDVLAGRIADVHVHLDADVLDTAIAPANSFVDDGGISEEQLRTALDGIARRVRIRSATIASWDPDVDRDDRMRGALVRVLAHLETLIDGG